MAVLEHFPFSQIRPLQKKVIEAVEQAFLSGKRIVILEAPVGSGKSPIAMAFARESNDCHIITPRKGLQDQYFQDFSEDIVLMKGRNAYPCTFGESANAHQQVIRMVNTGRVNPPKRGEPNCAEAPCINKESVGRTCESVVGVCPYKAAMELAQQSPVIVHNIHSFIFQANLADKFQRRKYMIIDEAHEVEAALRGFLTKEFKVREAFEEEDIPRHETMKDWCDWFASDRFAPSESDRELRMKESVEGYKSQRDKWLEAVMALREATEFLDKDFTMKYELEATGGTKFEFIPHSLGNSVNSLLLDFGDRVLLMSGTVYDKKFFCSNLGIKEEDAFFIRVPSTFPVENRPLYAKAEYQVDTSHLKWGDNFPEIIEKVKKVCEIFHSVKGLIHTPSYYASDQILKALKDRRFIAHDRSDFTYKLEEFFGSTEPKVFLSPICQQGVDFKGDRARFQIILRVPYSSTGDPFVGHMVKNNFKWYNHQALVAFGQQIGRVVRSENDYGATILVDSRFNQFLSRNSGKLPEWVKNAVIYK